jgi:citrate lyase alpha subunit
MALGPGKYDKLCTHVREQAKADAAIVIVLNGNLGDGFSMQTERLEALVALPDILRDTARQIEESYRRM